MAIALVGLGLLGASPAGAQQRPPSAGATDALARAKFQEGLRAFEEGRYGDALANFEEAHTLSRRAAILYNIGVCHERLGQHAEAITAFEAYLAAEPGTPNRAAIERQIAAARARLQPARPSPR
jgi:tetratricopeptide (TPR) repeat protein